MKPIDIKVRKDSNNNSRPTVQHLDRKKQSKTKPKDKHKNQEEK